MVENCLAEQLPQGLMIKGPQGIGKSHSIVNLVRQLLYHSNCKYFVTYISNCAFWTGEEVLLEFICESFGSTPDDLGINITGVDQLNEILLKEFVEAIDKKLLEQGRQWIFIFNQINNLFARYPDKKDITTLPFPFNYMHRIMKPGRITTIISWAYSHISHRDKHSDFLDYHHCLSLDKEEMVCIFPSLRSLDDEVIESLMAKTGMVPLQVQELLSHQSNKKKAKTIKLKCTKEK